MTCRLSVSRTGFLLPVRCFAAPVTALLPLLHAGGHKWGQGQRDRAQGGWFLPAESSVRAAMMDGRLSRPVSSSLYRRQLGASLSAGCISQFCAYRSVRPAARHRRRPALLLQIQRVRCRRWRQPVQRRRRGVVCSAADGEQTARPALTLSSPLRVTKRPADAVDAVVAFSRAALSGVLV